MKLKLILTIIALRFSAKCGEKKTLALYVPRRRRRRPVFPYKADACTESCVVSTPATNRRETSVLIRSDVSNQNQEKITYKYDYSKSKVR